MDQGEYYSQILDHYQKIWNGIANTYLWDKGPIEKLPFNFRVIEFEPNKTRRVWTYATIGMSQELDNNPIELHIFSSIRDTNIIELLTVVAYYHCNTKKIDLNNTINFGRPWQNKSLCEYGFISLPYLDGPIIENLELNGSNKLIKFYWLIPITEKEVDYKKLFGSEALENEFEKTGLDYIDPSRKSIV